MSRLWRKCQLKPFLDRFWRFFWQFSIEGGGVPPICLAFLAKNSIKGFGGGECPRNRKNLLSSIWRAPLERWGNLSGLQNFCSQNRPNLLWGFGLCWGKCKVQVLVVFTVLQNPEKMKRQDDPQKTKVHLQGSRIELFKTVTFPERM